MATPARNDPALVLGATGGFGGAMIGALREAGWPVRALVRNPGRAERRWGNVEGVEIVVGDVQNRDAVVKAAEGCAVIVHGINYPYDRWVPFMQTATLNLIAAARTSGALLLFPGNVYGFGPQTAAPLDETAPMEATTQKGRLRIRLESLLEEATRTPDKPPEAEVSGDSGEPAAPPSDDATQRPIRVLVLRAGDFFGPTVRNGVVDRIFGNAAKGKRPEVFGRLDVAHEWAYLPDLARVGVALLDHAETFAPFEVVHMRGHVAESQRAFLTRVAERAKAPANPHVVPWAMVRLFGMFNGEARELLELRYLFETAVTLDDTKRRHILPDTAMTPLDEAIDTTLESYRR